MLLKTLILQNATLLGRCAVLWLIYVASSICIAIIVLIYYFQREGQFR